MRHHFLQTLELFVVYFFSLIEIGTADAPIFEKQSKIRKKDLCSKFLHGRFLIQGYQDVNNFQCKLNKHNIQCLEYTTFLVSFKFQPEERTD